MNCGIIGYGKMGKIRHAAISHCGGTVKSVYELDGSVDVPNRVASVDDILFDEEIDAVFVCTPNFLNKDLTVRAMLAGKHVFCEKPPAFTAEDILEIQEIEHSTERKLMYGFNHRHHDSVRDIKRMVEEGEFGKILWIRSRYGKCVDETFFDNWRSKKELAGGGILLDQGIHMLDLLLYLSNDFDEVHAIVSNNFWKIDGIEDNVFAIFKNNESGISASLHSTMTQWRHLFSLEIFLEKGYLTLNGLKTPSGAYGKEILTIAKNRTEPPLAKWVEENDVEYDVDNSWNSEVGYFFQTITNNTNVGLGNSDDALKLMKIIDRIYGK
jgi:predicted dehydrogenase